MAILHVGVCKGNLFLPVCSMFFFGLIEKRKKNNLVFLDCNPATAITCLAMTHTGQREEWRPAPIWDSIRSAIYNAGLSPDNTIIFIGTSIFNMRCVCMCVWQGHIDRGPRIAQFTLRWGEEKSFHQFLQHAAGAQLHLPLGGEAQDPLLFCSCPLSPFLGAFLKLLYMIEGWVVHPCVQWTFLWKTSVGSKPCSDSCLVSDRIST